ncbi:MAG: hypothetical protein AAGG72_01720 [Pseudomonadota bacterium]
MPTLFRFLINTSLIAAVGIGCLYVMATYFEPEQRETSHTLVGVEINDAE